MKKKLSIIGCLLLVATLGVAQFVAGPRIGNITSDSYPITIVTGASNLANTMSFPVPASGKMRFYLEMASTNASTAGVQYDFQISPDGSRWFFADFVSNGATNLTRNLNGTTAVRAYTNHWRYPTNTVTAAVVLDLTSPFAGARYIRCYRISNSHSASVFITNAYFSAHD